MTTSRPVSQDVAIIGAGISGLVAAHRWHELAPDDHVTVYETSDLVGGVLQTVCCDGYLIERSADSFITDQPWAMDLCRRIGIEGDLIGTLPTQRRAFVVCQGRLQPIPEAFQIMTPGNMLAVLKSPILSVRGKLRLVCERFVAPQDAGAPEESLEQFATRRLGRETYERLVQPLVSGIYTADPQRLSVAATMPRFVEMERQFGSLTRAALARRSQTPTNRSESGARYGLFVTPRNGIQSLVAAIVDKLPPRTLKFRTTIESIDRTVDGKWSLKLGDSKDTRIADQVIVATPSHVTSRLLSTVDAPLGELLDQIHYAGCVVVCLGFQAESFARPLRGFGFVVPRIENRKILAASFSSRKFPGRAPDGHELIRTFVGGALQPDLLQLSDPQLVDLARGELADLIGAKGEPTLVEVARWDRAMPQYHVGHLSLVDRIEKRCEAVGKLALIGNAYRGVGLPHCIHQAESAVEKMLATRNK